MQPNELNFRYLNRDGVWNGFHWTGLELRSDGALQLASVPRLEADPAPDVSGLPVPDVPAGIAVDLDGSVFYTDPAANRILRFESCFGETSVLPWKFKQLRGIHIPSYRRALMAADAGTGHVDVFDIETGQLVQVWEGFTEPWAIASDASGNSYVADYGASKVLKYSIAGDADPTFTGRVSASGLVGRPVGVAVDSSGAVYIVSSDGRLAVFDGQGYVQAQYAGKLGSPLAITVRGNNVYCGDNVLRQLIALRREGNVIALTGAAVGYEGPVAALAFDTKGQLLVHTGASLAPVTLAAGSGYGETGTVWSDAVSAGKVEHAWYRLRATVQQTSPEAHIQFFVRTSNQPDNPPPPFPSADWAAQTLDVADFLIGGSKAKYFWVGARLVGDRKSTPVLAQMRVEFDHQGYTTYLPEIYREKAACSDFLSRFLALFETMFAGPESLIDGLPALFDPYAVPAEYLPWLATWLALDLPEDLGEQAQRDAVAGAFRSYARRGTAEGLRQALRTYAGVEAIIEEPIRFAAWWTLPQKPQSCGAPASEPEWRDGEYSILGLSTALIAAEPQGAVAGTTAVLDRSYLISAEEYGEPLFSELAHRFTVRVYPRDADCETKLDEVRTIIEREKPAHTEYHLCIVSPGMRVGYSAVLGVDTIVGGPQAPTKLGVQETDLVLAGAPPGSIGMESRVGQTTQL